MAAHESSLKLIKAFLDPGMRNVLSLPLAALVLGALSQVESAIEFADRVCGQYSQISRDEAKPRSIGEIEIFDQLTSIRDQPIRFH